MNRVKVTFTPGNSRDTITYKIHGTVVCSRDGRELNTSGTYLWTDMMWRPIFGSRSKVRDFVDAGKPLTKTLALTTLGYDSCDQVQA